MGRALALVAILIGLTVISGCTQNSVVTSGDKNQNTDQTKQPDMTPVETVRNYLTAGDFDSLSEAIDAKKNQKQYTFGYWNEYLDEVKKYFSDNKNAIDSFIKNYDVLCNQIYKAEDCEKVLEDNKKYYSYSDEAKILIVNETERKVDSSVVYAEFMTDSADYYGITKTDFRVFYYLKISNDKWMIYDRKDYNETSPDSERYTIDVVKNNFANSLQNSTDFFTSRIKFMEDILKDKCTYVLKEGGTTAELNQRMSTCYSSKYNQYALNTGDYSVCDEIWDPMYLGYCYSSAAIKLNMSICEKTPKNEYDATGYYEKLNSMDICYYYYAFNAYSGNKQAACSMISNTQLKNDCVGLTYY